MDSENALWLVPPPGGWRADDLDRLPPDAPRHIELIDGRLSFGVPRNAFQAKVIKRADCPSRFRSKSPSVSWTAGIG